MKVVYFVRHGESVINDESVDTYVSATAPLSEKGVAQTKMIADRAARLSFDALIASPYTRAHETARAIEERTGKSIEISDLFTENVSPTSFEGMTLHTPDFDAKMQAWRSSIYGDAPKYEDGETFDELRARATAALAFLEHRSEERLLVVTHGNFLRMMMATLLLPTEFRAVDFKRFIAGTVTDNTGISMFQFVPVNAPGFDPAARWRIRVFNDHAHLG